MRDGQSSVFLPTDKINSILDTDTFVWSSGGDSSWKASVSYTGNTALVSGAIADDNETSVQASIKGITSLRFYWKISSELNFDFLTFYIDDVEIASVSGEADS